MPSMPMRLRRGNLWSTGSYARPMTDASVPVPAVEHYANGRVKFEGVHLDGEMHGDWAFWHKRVGHASRSFRAQAPR